MVEERRKQCDCKLLSYLAAAPSLAGLIIKSQDVYFHGDVFSHVVFTVNAFHVKKLELLDLSNRFCGKNYTRFRLVRTPAVSSQTP